MWLVITKVIGHNKWVIMTGHYKSNFYRSSKMIYYDWSSQIVIVTGHHKSHLVWLESRRFIRLIIICGHYDQSLQISTWSDITKVIITDFYKSHYDRLYKSHFLWSYGQYKSHYDQSLQMSTWPDIAKSLWSVLQKSLWAIFIKIIMTGSTKVIVCLWWVLFKNHYD